MKKLEVGEGIRGIVEKVNGNFEEIRQGNRSFRLNLSANNWAQKGNGIYTYSLSEEFPKNAKLNLSFTADETPTELQKMGVWGIVAENSEGSAAILLYGERPMKDFEILIEVAQLNVGGV